MFELKNQLVFYRNPLTRRVIRWNEKDDCCSWEGVGCDDSGHVISLQLEAYGMKARLNESSSLFSLNYLKELNMESISWMESLIPREIHKLTNLTSLNLSNCSLEGTVPEVIFHLPALQHLDLSQNPSLTGTIPQFPHTDSFRTIVLSYTNFSGPLPNSITNLTRLSHLDLSHCNFTGSIPFTLSNLTELVDVDLSHNLFSGSISSNHFEGLSNVERIDLSFNSLSGTIPMSTFALPSLQLLDLSGNQFSGQISEFPIVNISNLRYLDLHSNRLGSSIPNSFFKLHSLQDLYLSDNLFNDSFQLEKILSLPNLRYLDLSNNSLSLDATSIPSNSNNSLVKQSLLSHLDLSNNKIAGDIPSWIWEIGDGSLYHLNLSCNMLVGLQKPYNFSTYFSLKILDLHSNQLRGEMTTLTTPEVRFLDISNNRLSGPFPTFICNATNLEVLDLSDNSFRGSIPHCLFQNVGKGPFPGSLKFLDLSNNNLVGGIPLSVENCTSLSAMDLSNNKLSGTIPTSLCNSRDLQFLDLSVNDFNGNIPLCLLEYIPVLSLGENNFTGRFPKINFTPDCGLQHLDLSSNNLTGEVPLSLANCSRLEVINVGGNRIDGNFPCMLPLSLRVLVLRDNRFHGDVRCDKSWPNLQIIDIAHNNFTGYLNPLRFSGWTLMMRDALPELSRTNLGFSANMGYTYRQVTASVGGVLTDSYVNNYLFLNSFQVTLNIKGVDRKLVKIWPDFTSIDLSCNNFQGDIPASIGELTGLRLLNLSHNALRGAIPKSFSKLRKLESLDLSVNQLTGKIPKEIAGLTFLQMMNVSHNELIGDIPVGSQIQTFPADCFEGNLGLCGRPLNISCANTHISPPEQGNVPSHGEIEWDYVFAAAGYAVGLGSFAWVLLFRRSFKEKYFEKVEDVFEKIVDLCQHKKRRGRGRRLVRVLQATRQ